MSGSQNALQPRPLKNPTQKEILLVENLKSRDDLTFNKLYLDYSPALLGIIFRIVRQEAEAEDVLQETFIKISNSLHLYDPDKSRLFTWLARIAKNKALDHIKSANSRHYSNMIDLDQMMAEAISGSYSINYNIELIGLKELIICLSKSQKEIIDLIYFQGYTQTEVAEKLNMPLSTVKLRIKSGVTALRGFFEKR